MRWMGVGHSRTPDVAHMIVEPPVVWVDDLDGSIVDHLKRQGAKVVPTNDGYSVTLGAPAPPGGVPLVLGGWGRLTEGTPLAATFEITPPKRCRVRSVLGFDLDWRELWGITALGHWQGWAYRYWLPGEPVTNTPFVATVSNVYTLLPPPGLVMLTSNSRKFFVSECPESIRDCAYENPLFGLGEGARRRFTWRLGRLCAAQSVASDRSPAYEGGMSRRRLTVS